MRGEPLAPGSIRPSEHSLDVLEEAVDLLGVESGGPPMSELDGSIDQGGRGPPVPCPGRAPTFAHGDDVDVALAAHIAASATEPTTYVPTRSSVRIEPSTAPTAWPNPSTSARLLTRPSSVTTD